MHTLTLFLKMILRRDTWPKALFIAAALVMTGHNGFLLVQETIHHTRIRQSFPYNFLGIRFAGIDDVLAGQRYVGYVTDKSLDDNFNARQFSQAQYLLAPIVLDLNATNHPFTLIDCSSEAVSQEKMREAGLVPLKRNNLGIYVAAQPSALPPVNVNRMPIKLMRKLPEAS